MDVDRLIRMDHPKSYCVVFPNFRALEEAEISRIFSEFGQVKQVTATGDERGFRFVRFCTYEEARHAVEGLRQHPDIKFCPPRSNNTSNKNHKQNHQQQQNLRRDSNFNKGRKYSSSDDLSEMTSTQLGLRAAPVCSSSDDDRSMSSSSGRSSGIEIDRSNSSDGRRPLSQQISHNGSVANLTVGYNDMQRQKSVNYKENRSGNGRYFDVQNLRQDKEIDGETSDLVDRNGQSAVQKVVPNASEVVVANIHPNFGPAYLLHLFEKFEPLAISNVMTIPNTSTRYCHVYFKKNQDAADVERHFDKHELLGKNLVVLRPSRLMLMSVINKQMGKR